MKKIFALVSAVLLMAGCSVQRDGVMMSYPQTVSEYHRIDGLSGIGVHGMVYIITLDRFIDEADGSVRHGIHYGKVLDFYCLELPYYTKIEKPII